MGLMQQQPINIYYEVYFSIATAVTKWVYNPFHDDTFLLVLPSAPMWTSPLERIKPIYFGTKWTFPLPLPSLSVNEP